MPDPRGTGPLIVNAFCNFHKQLEYPGDIVVKMYVSDPGAQHVRELGHHRAGGPPGVVYASGGATTVWVDFPKQKSVTMPDWFRKHLT